ncbi:virus ReqiPepy6 Gp37-like protein [Mesobacillus persicus]|uniref:Virus ReqiPepy6 Gp37-like protein n=1 Tax=Mesobacillus persicus TaxID=930146 RepID=A0A1H7XLL5_9BACI|nr:hypothetical protein [Mesobacillus persicus]SEM34641.1 virus ReqiPepy6 Gp37-like protein [Mesobacillus persicus]
MWYIFSTNFVLKGVITEINTVTIEHHFYECDVVNLVIPYTQEVYETLKIGDVIHQGKGKKGYRVHTLEISEIERTIFVGAYGVEGILNQRIISKPFEMNANMKQILYTLIQQNLGSGASSNRRIDSLLLPTIVDEGENISVSYYGENLYTVISELSKQLGMSVKFDFNPYPEYASDGTILTPANINLSFHIGQDLTTGNSEHPPIIWKANWGDTRDELLFLSQKHYKNAVYLKSGDETPIQVEVNESSGLTGWDRFEMFSDAVDIRKGIDETTTLTDQQVRKLLESRGKLELFRNYKLDDFTFILNEDIPQVFQKDFFVGDFVTVVNEKFGITRHSRIVTVIETIIQEKSQTQVKFED